MIDMFAINNCTALFIQKPKKDLGLGGYLCKADFFAPILCYILYWTIILNSTKKKVQEIYKL